MILRVEDYLSRDQPMSAGYWNSTNERTESDYLMIKQLIPRFKITCFCNFLDLYKYLDSHYFQKSQLFVKVYIKYICPGLKFHLEKEQHYQIVDEKL